MYAKTDKKALCDFHYTLAHLHFEWWEQRLRQWLSAPATNSNSYTHQKRPNRFEPSSKLKVNGVGAQKSLKVAAACVTL